MSDDDKDSRDDLIIAALACGKSYREASEAVGVAVSTITLRMSDPAFRERVRAVRRELIDRATGLLVSYLADAAAALHAIATGDGPAAVRVRAAAALLEIGLKFYEHTDVEARMRRLEEQLGIAAPRGGGGADGDASRAA